MSGTSSQRPLGVIAHLEPGPGSPQHSAQQHLIEKQVHEGRRKFYNHLEDHVLDYLHNNPVHIEACLNTCIKLFGNVVHNPLEEKYRKVKAGNNLLKSTVLLVKGGEDLLLHAGWVPRTIEMEKFWIFDAAEDSVRFGVLKEALHLCERALATVHEKAEKKRREREEKLHNESAEKERIRLAIEDDKAQRKLRSEVTAAHSPVPAAPLGGPQQQQQSPQSRARASPGRASPALRRPGGNGGGNGGGGGGAGRRLGGSPAPGYSSGSQ